MICFARDEYSDSRPRRILECLVVTLCLLKTAWAEEGSAACRTCHVEQVKELDGSVHRAVPCQDCHGGDPSYTIGDDELGVFLKRSRESRPLFDHGPSFSVRPVRPDVPGLCGGCHAEVELMNPYGLRTDQLSRYWTSGHGKILKNTGYHRVTVCVDCHGSHYVIPAHEPGSKTHALNVPDTCGECHATAQLMAEFNLPVDVVREYRESVQGQLLLEEGDTGAPTCATCHGNHSAMPPGFAEVGAVCGQCHQHAATTFATSVHAMQEEHKGCVECHGGGEGRTFHLIERITRAPGAMIERYAHLLASNAAPTPEEVTKNIHPEAREIMIRALPTCHECHEEPDDDESLAKIFDLLNEITGAERHYVRTARRLDDVGQGILLVDNQRFRFEDAKTLLIELAPLQHTLDNATVATVTRQPSAIREGWGRIMLK